MSRFILWRKWRLSSRGKRLPVWPHFPANFRDFKNRLNGGSDWERQRI